MTLRVYLSGIILLCVLPLSLTKFGPFSNVDPAQAHRRHVNHPLSPSRIWGSIQKPYPTNAWWLNLIMGNGEQTLKNFPYISKAKTREVCFTRPNFSENKQTVMATYLDEWCIEAPGSEHRITSYDDIGVVVEYPSGGSQKQVFPFVPGSPFIVAEISGTKFKVKTIMAVLEVKDEVGRVYSPQQTVITQPSSKFTLRLNNGRTWVVYFDKKIALVLTLGAFESTVVYSGSMKFAALDNDQMLNHLDKYRNAYVVGGDAEYSTNGDLAIVNYVWKKKGSGGLLMLGLPHHIAHIKGAEFVKEVSYRTIRGEISGILGDNWSLHFSLPKYTWDSPTPIDASKINRIKEALKADAGSSATEGDPYFFGVAIGRLAKLALIADQLNENDIAKSIRANMEKFITPWLLGTNPDALLYDSTYGGIVSTKGVSNPGEDFGNGYYNDHHFHYGYHVFACAVIGRKNPEFLKKYKEEILTYARDYANPSKNDKFFIPSRNKDWFEWHSWAAGLFEFGDGRNQESTSEALMAYYGLMLLGESMGNKEMKDYGRLLLAMEIISTKTYWHIPSKSTVYPEVFKSNKMVGILWSNKVDYATFFGLNPIFIHGIQMLPFLPPTEYSLDKEFIREEYPVISGETTPADWMPYKACARAIIEPEQAWNEAVNLKEFHTGTCMTITLHWIATRPH